MAAQNRSRKSRSTAAAVEQTPALIVGVADTGMVDSSEVIIADPAGDAIGALLAELETPAATGDAVIESPIHDDAALESAVAGAEATEASLAMATPEGVVDPGAVPTGTSSDAAPVEGAAPAKKERTPRKHYSDKVERLKDRVGDGLAEFTVLTMEQAGVTDEELQAVMASTLAVIKAMNKKEQARASMFIEWLAGKKAKPNAILESALRVLNRDGKITTGKEGNLFLDLLSQTYSAGAARAMGGNTVSMLADLKVLHATEKGTFVANPDSLLLMKAQSLLAAPAAAPAAATTEPAAA